jgi:AraC-like DNA-binding protein
MLYLSYRPHPLLRDVIDYLWLLSDAPGHAKERIVPSGTLELVINLREDAIRIYDRTKPSVCRTFPGIVVSGAYTDFFVIDTAEHALMMGVHFKPGGAMPFLGARADELTDRHVDVESLWGASAKELRERLCAATTHQHCFRILETALLDRTRSPLKHRDEVQMALACFENGAKVGDVADRIGLSHRHFIDLFTAEVGMTPKVFCRVRRFQRALSALGPRDPPDWANLASRCGYFDQSHLIRDFVAFSGFGPTEFVSHRNDRLKENHLVLA